MSSLFKTMEAAFHDEARRVIKQGLQSLPSAHQRVFRMMYARDDGKRSVQDAEAMPLDDVLAEIPADKLDWVMQQIQASQEKLALHPLAAAPPVLHTKG